MSKDNGKRALVLPHDVETDQDAFEILSAWVTHGKIKLLSRSGTSFDSRPEHWGEILAGMVWNIAGNIELSTNQKSSDTALIIATEIARIVSDSRE